MSDHRRKREAWEAEAESFSNAYIHVCTCGGVGFVRINTPIGHRLFGKAIPCACKRDDQAKQRAATMRRLSGISGIELSTWTFETFTPEKCGVPQAKDSKAIRTAMGKIKQICEEYAKEPTGWLVLSGIPGTGKTHLAYAIAAQQLAVGRPVFAHTVPAMLDLLRGAVASETYEGTFAMIRDVNVLVLDDLGAQRGTDWADQALYELLNHRYANRLPLVVTMNRAPGECGMDERLVSRLQEGTQTAGGWSRILAFPCSDYRPKARYKSKEIQPE